MLWVVSNSNHLCLGSFDLLVDGSAERIDRFESQATFVAPVAECSCNGFTQYGDHLGIRITSGQFDYLFDRLYNDRTQKGLLIDKGLKFGFVRYGSVGVHVTFRSFGRSFSLNLTVNLRGTDRN